MRARRIAAGVALASAGLMGCRAPAIEAEDLPQAPIAFIRQPASAGRISLAELREALAPTDDGEAPRRALSAQLSMLTPSTGAITRIPGASRGDRPLDWSGDGARLLVGRAAPGIRRLELHAWDRRTGAWSRPTLELARSGAAWADGPIRVAWDAIRSGAGVPWIRYTIRVIQGTESARDLPSALGGSDPDLASDGSRLVFARPGSSAGEDGLILLATPAGEEPQVLARGASPRFSRDGRWIVFTRGPVGARDIWLMRSDGRARRALTDSALHDEEHPCLSPDGAWVVYASARGARGQSQLYAIRLADRRERQLTLSGQNVWPVW